MATSEITVIFSILEGKFCVARLAADSQIPEGLPTDGFLCITRTEDELSIVCREDVSLPEAQIERAWRCLKVKGPLEFSLKGVLASLLQPLAEAGIAVFAISTYDTDYVLIKQVQLATAIQSLEACGHRLSAE